MTRFREALLASALATGVVAGAWMVMTRRGSSRSDQSGSYVDRSRQRERTRDDEIEELTQPQKDLMLRELSQHL